jgi:hypothetical protein
MVSGFRCGGLISQRRTLVVWQVRPVRAPDQPVGPVDTSARPSGPTELSGRGHRPYMLAETELLQLTRKAEHNELVRKFAAAGLFPSE